MNLSDYAAWYGAILGTAVLVWDYVKRKKGGPRIKAEAQAGWRTAGFDADDNEDVIRLTVTNTGDRSTTLMSWGLYGPPANTQSHETSKRRAFIIPRGLHETGIVPHKLAPGDNWTRLGKESHFRDMLATGKCHMALSFLHAEKDILVEVSIDKTSS